MVFIVILLNLKIEDSVHTKVKAMNGTKILINSEIAYKLQDRSKITLEINKKYYTYLIKNIEFDKESKMFILSIQNFKTFIIPNSTMNASIIFDNKPIYSFIFSK